MGNVASDLCNACSEIVVCAAGAVGEDVLRVMGVREVRLGTACVSSGEFRCAWVHCDSFAEGAVAKAVVGGLVEC